MWISMAMHVNINAGVKIFSWIVIILIDITFKLDEKFCVNLFG